MSTSLAPLRWSGRGPVRRAASLLLWQAAPWVLVVLVVLSVLGNVSVLWASLSGGQGDGPVSIDGDGGVAAGVSVFVGVALFFTWTRAVPTVVPVLVAGGMTRRAAVRGLLLAAAALAAVATGLLVAVAVAGAAVQRGVTGAVAPAVAVDGARDASPSTLTMDVGSAGADLDPLVVILWFFALGLAGALFGALWYRWRGRGVLGLLAALVVGWLVGRRLVAALSPGVAGPGSGYGSAEGLTVVAGVGLLLAAALWWVLRRVPLRPPA